MTEENKDVVFHSFDDALQFLTDTRNTTEAHIVRFRHHVKEFTGYEPDARLGPMDVVNIVQKVFGGKLDAQRPAAPDCP